MLFASPSVEIERRGGAVILRSQQPLAPHARCVGDWLVGWAERAPARTFLAERTGRAGGGAWRLLSYGEAWRRVPAIAQGLVDLGASRERPVLLLSDNGIDHALVQLAAMHAGVPAAPISPPYSLATKDFTKLRQIVETVRPGVAYVDDPAPFAAAIAAAIPGVPLVSSRGAAAAIVSDLESRSPGPALERANGVVGPDTVAKILFTSGSTGTPKGVVNTQRMLCSNQQAISQVWPLLARRPPVVVDSFSSPHRWSPVKSTWSR